MRTNIDIDNELMSAAMKATGLKTKKAVVEEGLRKLVKFKRQAEAFDALWGIADWEGDLREMREDRNVGHDNC